LICLHQGKKAVHWKFPMAALCEAEVSIPIPEYWGTPEIVSSFCHYRIIIAKDSPNL
jgi:hypothetical protein